MYIYIYMYVCGVCVSYAFAHVYIYWESRYYVFTIYIPGACWRTVRIGTTQRDISTEGTAIGARFSGHVTFPTFNVVTT